MTRMMVVIAFATLLVPASVSAQPRDQLTRRNAEQRDLHTREATVHAYVSDDARAGAVISPFTVTSIRFVREVDGTVSAVGEVQNVTNTTLTFGQVAVAFYANGVLLGTEDTYIFAPLAVP